MTCENLDTQLNIPTPLIRPTKVVDCHYSTKENGNRCSAAAVFTDGVLTNCVGACELGRKLEKRSVTYPKPMHNGTGRG